jgi:flavin-dependent dehydrogenase
LLEALGVQDRVDAAGFLRPNGAHVHWDEERVRIPFDGETRGYQVDRARFDEILLEAACEAGANVEWRPLPENLNSAFVADATGRRGLLPGRRRRLGPPLLALYAYWRGVAAGDGATLVEAGRDGWFWGAPLPDGRFNATFFTDPRTISGDPGVAYDTALRESRLLNPRVKGAERESATRACDASCWVELEPAGQRYIKVGEAAFTVDALSSQGVQLAMQSAWQASTVIHASLSGGDAESLRTEYRSRLTATACSNYRIAAEYYAKLERYGLFWAERGTLL